MIKALERSMRRLDTSYIDLYQIHWPSPISPLKRALRALERKLEEGKIRAIGVSNFSLEQLKEARGCLAKQDIASNQVEYNLLRRDIERDLLPYCQKEGITVIAYSPLAQGLLTGKYGPSRMPRGLQRRFMIWAGYRRINWSVVDELKKVAEVKNAAPAQVALSWVIRHKGVVAIPGAKDVRHVRENVAALDIALKEEELARLDAKPGLEAGL
ncbi:MAG: aldo/keto reductase [Candidatus Korarchaeota archaeon]|nr:aldo/keto reductase [Candidatus Korarchaeota archaeon]